ncbi:MAG: 1-acyl-sn-glycerol-3-phosphate acyltransferase [Rhizobiaceae bacterium]|nr:1-acyl-sn-glycerol-3-phosphate acyltransferase [Rhizobiaceae bacterium]MCV0407350.1 1-acyl-sn-glycerol-3-phosphate acyltransferase [Rhizobiaceae bacterium]
MDVHSTPSALSEVFERGEQTVSPDLHIVDQLIAERATHLSRHVLWPVMRPILYRMFHYRQAVAMADDIAPLSGWDAFSYISALLSLDVTVIGGENIPDRGGFIMAPSHPTGIADGIAIFDMMKDRRSDLAIFANRDALRACPGFRDLIIPVEWRQHEKSHAKSRDTLEMTAKAFADQKAVVLFPAGRIAYWNEGRLTERPWQNSAVGLARRYQVPLVPTRITARNSGLFYFLSKYSTELRDMTVFHELLNKTGRAVQIVVGKPITPEALEGDAAEVTARLQEHTVFGLAADRNAPFEPLVPATPAAA